MLLVGVVVAYAGYLGFEHYPASLSAIPYRDKLLPVIVEKWSEQRKLYTPFFESQFAAFVRSHPMEMMGWYGAMGLFLLLSREYRNAGWECCLLVLWYGIFIPILFFLGLIVAQWGINVFHFFGGGESSVAFVDNMRTNFIGTLLRWLTAVVIGIPVMLFGFVVGLAVHAAVYVVPPLYILFVLFALPSIAFVILRLLVRLPFLIYHHLHYLTVPHPAETAYRAGMANGIPMPELASTVADVMYQYDHLDYDALPKAWKSKNWTKRIDAFRDRLKPEDRFMEELIKNLRLKSQFRE
jgi:hypothetical protein